MKTTSQTRLTPFALGLLVSFCCIYSFHQTANTAQPPKTTPSTPIAPPPAGWMKGMTVSCYGWGAAWGRPVMQHTMKKLKKLGVNWISYHPYAWIRSDGTLRYSRSLQQQTVLRPLQYGKQLKLKMLLKPHIGHWGSKFSWRGSISFQTEAGWKRFFRHYKDWIIIQAKMAEKGKADLFSIGVEYRKTLHRTKEWHDIIKAVRAVYSGKITYSANWDVYQKVTFWDKLDYIGIQAYFPLTKQPNPNETTLKKAWQSVLSPLRKYAKKHKKPIIFTELGYNRASHTAARPWDHAEGGKHAMAIKNRCVKVALQQLSKENAIKGVFLWKWFPSRWHDHTNYTLHYPEMESIIRQTWSPPHPPASR
jgi:hypothetical protein